MIPRAVHLVLDQTSVAGSMMMLTGSVASGRAVRGLVTVEGIQVAGLAKDDQHVAGL